MLHKMSYALALLLGMAITTPAYAELEGGTFTAVGNASSAVSTTAEGQ